MKKENLNQIDTMNKIHIKTLTVIILGIFIVYLGYILFSSNKANTTKIPFPYSNNVSQNTSFACKSILSSTIIGNSGDIPINGIEASIEKGTDQIAMNIKDPETLIFQTGANISAGITDGDEFRIIQNDDTTLSAVWYNSNTVSTIVLNKSNGIAIWLRGTPTFITFDAPYANTIYMTCT